MSEDSESDWRTADEREGVLARGKPWRQRAAPLGQALFCGTGRRGGPRASETTFVSSKVIDPRPDEVCGGPPA